MIHQQSTLRLRARAGQFPAFSRGTDFAVRMAAGLTAWRMATAPDDSFVIRGSVGAVGTAPRRASAEVAEAAPVERRLGGLRRRGAAGRGGSVAAVWIWVCVARLRLMHVPPGTSWSTFRRRTSLNANGADADSKGFAAEVLAGVRRPLKHGPVARWSGFISSCTSTFQIASRSWKSSSIATRALFGNTCVR